MTGFEASRRDALRGAALGAGALATTGFLGPARAAAQSPSDEDLRDFLAEAIALEQLTVLAYARAADSEAASADLARTLDGFRDQEQAHANALRTALDSLGFDPPPAPNAPEDTDVFDDVDGLETETAEQLTNLLERMDELTKLGEWLEYLSDLERRQLTYYVDTAPGLDSEDLATTAAEIAGCQAQHLQVLGVEGGDDAAKAATEAAAAASAAPAQSATGE